MPPPIDLARGAPRPYGRTRVRRANAPFAHGGGLEWRDGISLARNNISSLELEAP